MTLKNFPWLFLLWPLLCGLTGWVVSYALRASSESRWRAQETVIAVEETQLLARLAQQGVAGLEAAAKNLEKGEFGLLQVVRDSQLAERERTLMRASPVQWLTEPDGYYRLRAAAEFEDSSQVVQWVVLTKRLSPNGFESSFWGRALPWLGFGMGSLFLWRQTRRRKRIAETIRSLQGLRTKTNKPMPRDEFLAMIPPGAISDDISRELMRLLDSYHHNFYSMHTGAGQSETVLAAMPVGILAFTSDLKLWFANRAGIDLLDLHSRIHDKSPLIELIRNPRVLDLIFDSQGSSQPRDTELEVSTALPNQFTVLRLRAMPLAHAAFTTDPTLLPPMLLVITDETRLRQLENYRRDFTANVSHELKTPLAAIKAYAETLLMGALDDPDARERFVQRIGEQATRLEQLILGLLQLTRIQSLPDKIPLTPIPLSALVRTLTDEQQPIAMSREIVIHNHIDDVSIRVMAEHEALRTILGNLISNAVRYSKPNSSVDLRAMVHAETVVVTVADQGIGIAESDLDRIFERFYIVDKARTQNAGGTGLGLAIVKHLTAAIGGSIRVRSRLDEGSEFQLTMKKASDTTSSLT
jgi:two-component system, OmpR family, phosphate regulon sensor histidine kinase PhoR